MRKYVTGEFGKILLYDDEGIIAHSYVSLNVSSCQRAHFVALDNNADNVFVEPRHVTFKAKAYFVVQPGSREKWSNHTFPRE